MARTVKRMTIQRMEHVGIVVDDLAAATAFFVELGLRLQGEGPVELTKFHASSGRGATGTRRRTARASALSHSQSMTSTPSSLACKPARGARWRGAALRRHLSTLLRPRPGGDHRRAGAADRLRTSAGGRHRRHGFDSTSIAERQLLPRAVKDRTFSILKPSLIVRRRVYGVPGRYAV